MKRYIPGTLLIAMIINGFFLFQPHDSWVRTTFVIIATLFVVSVFTIDEYSSTYE